MVGISLTDFRTNILDVARNNRFEVLITPPTSYQNSIDGDILERLSYMAETAQISARTQGEIKLKYFGMELKLPGEYSRENLTIGFLSTYDWKGRDFFDMWMEWIQQTSEGNVRESTSSIIEGTELVVNQLGRGTNPIASYVFYNVFPTNISAIELNMGEYDQPQKYQVSFAYSHMITAIVDSGGGGGNNNPLNEVEQ